MTVNVDVVRAEFEKLLRQAETVNEKAAQALEQTLRAELRRRRRPPAAHARAVPRRPRRAALDGRRAVRRVEARQRDRPDRLDARALLRRRRLEARAAARPDPAQLADAPVPPGDDRRVPARSRSASSRSRPPPPRAAPSAPGPRPRAATSRTCSRRCSPTSPAAPATCSTGPGPRPAPLLKSKKGDFVLTLDARVARGCDVRVVIEAKDRPMSMRAMRDELREARENRGAAVAVVVFTPAHAPTGRRAVRPRRRRRLLRDRSGGARAGHPRGRRSAWPGCSRSRRSSSTRSRSTPRRSRPR